MDQFPTDIPGWGAAPPLAAWLVFGAWLVLGVGVYLGVARAAIAGGGKVSAKEFAAPDMILCGAFIAWFLANIVSGFGEPQHDVTQSDIVENAAIYLAIIGLLFMFMAYRGLNPVRQFGIARRNLFLCIGMAAGLVLAAHSLVIATELCTVQALHGDAKPQSVVEFFVDASEKSDARAVYTMLAVACVVAPIAEETIFRGYVYGVLKRYVGGVRAGLISAALFAAMHLNLAALPALFVLALCLTLAYEATGSLLVNIFMHGFFNLSMLLMMLYFTAHPTAP